MVVGASGLVGGALCQAFGRGGAQVVGTYRSRRRQDLVPLDVKDAEAVQRCVEQAEPDVVCFAVNVPGGVDACESRPEDSYALNVEAARHVARAAAGHGAVMVFYSTDYLFDGTRGPYAEEDPSAPLQVYGRHKLEAEQAIQGLAPQHVVMRLNAVFGWDAHSKNFAMQVWERLRTGQTMRVPEDQWCTPTLAEDVADITVRLVHGGARGVFNVSGKDWVSRAELGKALAEAMELDPALIAAVPTSALGQKAPRPLKAGLRTEKIARFLGMEPSTLKESLARFRSRWKSETH